MTRAVIYVRVSSDEQVKGMSLDFQKQDCLAYAKKKNLDIECLYEERGESAKFADRPELIKLLDYCQKHSRRVDALIVWKLDRLSRNQLDYYYIKRKLMNLGIAIHSATEPSVEDSSSIAGKIFETFSALQAELDNSIRSERARRGLEAKLMGGIYPWKPPIGYLTEYAIKHGVKKTRPDEPDPVYFPIIQAALRQYAQGQHSQRDLIGLLDQHGMALASGRKTYPQLANRLVCQYLDYYRGVLINPWTGETVKGRHSPMLTEEEYLRIVAVRDGRSLGRTAKKRRNNPDVPLRRLLICPDCGKFYTGSVSRGHGGRYTYYHCVTRDCLNYAKGIRAPVAEAAFEALVAQYTLSDEFLLQLKDRLEAGLSEMNLNARVKLEQCDHRLAVLEEKKKHIYEMREDGSYGKDEFLERKGLIEKEMSGVLWERSEHSLQNIDLDRLCAYALEFTRQFGGKWTIMPLEIRQRFQNLVFPEGISYHPKNGFGTCKVGPIFGLFRDLDTEKSSVVHWMGFDWNLVYQDLRKLAQLANSYLSRTISEENAVV